MPLRLPSSKPIPFPNAPSQHWNPGRKAHACAANSTRWGRSTWSASAWAICWQRVHAYCAFCAPVVWWVLEQPASSTLEYLPIFQDMVRMIPCRRLHIFMSHYGGPTKKPTYLYSSDLQRNNLAEMFVFRHMVVGSFDIYP